MVRRGERSNVPIETKCTATKCSPFRHQPGFLVRNALTFFGQLGLGRLASNDNDEERRQKTDKLAADLRYGFFTSAAR
jgi:hypothetical protein